MAKKKEKGLLETAGDAVLSVLAFNPDAIEVSGEREREEKPQEEVADVGVIGGRNGAGGKRLKPGSTFKPAPAKREEPEPEPDEPAGEAAGKAAEAE